ncbi:MAG: cation transporter [Spirochaetaceae bacterium]|jgi:copper ion binding protein|nr:cation transporter [Spirochaetaceae bacterium]
MKTTLKIDGMSCDHCVRHVKDALEGIAGVKSAQVSLNTNSAEVNHEDGVSLDTMTAAVVDAGYEVV